MPKKPSKLGVKLKGVRIKRKTRSNDPVWKGPEVDGITQSLLSRFLVCRERFRLLVVEGLRPADTFNHRIEYGNMWHVCEEEVASKRDWLLTLKKYALCLCTVYRTQQEQIQHWYNVCKTQFPIYVDYWARHKDTKQRTPLLQEQVFDVPYKLPSGRMVRLRGKWDGVDLIGKGRNAGVYLQENKTKGQIDEEQMKRQLSFDLQTSIYLVALTEYTVPQVGKVRTDTVIDHTEEVPGTSRIKPKNIRLFSGEYPVQGVRYNVVRRPLSGGKGSIRQHKPTKTKPQGESSDEFYARLGDEHIAKDPGHYFMRWKVEVTPQDLDRFKREFLDPILEQLCNWWEFISGDRDDPFKLVGYKLAGGGNVDHFYGGIHHRTPYGIYNILAEGGSSDLDEYLATGSEIGLERTDQLFRELV